MIISSRMLLLVALASVVACGAEPRIYSGHTGRAVPLTMYSGIPTIVACVNDGPERRFALDTGAPMTVLAKAAFDDIDAGFSTVRLEAFGLQYARLPVATRPATFGEGGCAEQPPVGLLGADVLQPFRVVLDYQERRVLLLDDQPPETPLTSQSADAIVEIAVEVLGGGSFSVPETGERQDVGPTRLIVPVEVEGVRISALIDTGAAFNAISASLLTALGGEERPRLCCVETHLSSGDPVMMELTRLREVRLGEIRADSQPALVFEDGKTFISLSLETGREVELILGAPFLRLFASSIDYGRERLRLQRYSGQDDLNARQFVMPGLSLCQSRASEQGALVVDVFEGFDAERQGIVSGDLIKAIGAQELAGSTDEQIMALIRDAAVGSTLSISWQNQVGALMTRDVLVEDLLPVYR